MDLGYFDALAVIVLKYLSVVQHIIAQNCSFIRR